MVEILSMWLQFSNSTKWTTNSSIGSSQAKAQGEMKGLEQKEVVCKQGIIHVGGMSKQILGWQCVLNDKIAKCAMKKRKT